MDTQPTDGQPARIAFDAEMAKRADEFCAAAMTAIPELHALAVIPVWSLQVENVPAGFLRLRNPQPPYTGSLMLMLTRLTAFSTEINRDLMQQMQSIDRYASELATQITARTQQLEQLNATQSAGQPNG